MRGEEGGEKETPPDGFDDDDEAIAIPEAIGNCAINLRAQFCLRQDCLQLSQTDGAQIDGRRGAV